MKECPNDEILGTTWNHASWWLINMINFVQQIDIYLQFDQVQFFF